MSTSSKPLLGNLDRAKNWDDDRKKLYRLQNNDASALSKRMTILKATELYSSTDEEGKRSLEENLRDEIHDQRVAAGTHGNAK